MFGLHSWPPSMKRVQQQRQLRIHTRYLRRRRHTRIHTFWESRRLRLLGRAALLPPLTRSSSNSNSSGSSRPPLAGGCLPSSRSIPVGACLLRPPGVDEVDGKGRGVDGGGHGGGSAATAARCGGGGIPLAPGHGSIDRCGGGGDCLAPGGCGSVTFWCLAHAGGSSSHGGGGGGSRA